MQLRAGSGLARYLRPFIDGESERRAMFVDTVAGVVRVADPVVGEFERRGVVRLLDMRTVPPTMRTRDMAGVDLLQRWDDALACGAREYVPEGE